MPQKGPSTAIATFLANLPAERRREVERVRKEVRRHLPGGYEEVISRNMLVYMGKACIRFKTADDLALDVVGQIVAAIPPERWVQIAQDARRR